MNVPRNRTVIDSLPLGGTTDWSVSWTEAAVNVPPRNVDWKLLELTAVVHVPSPGTVKVPIVTGRLSDTVEKLLVPPWVVAFSTVKLVRVKSDCPVSLAPSEKLSEPVIGTALAAPAQATAAATSAALAR